MKTNPTFREGQVSGELKTKLKSYVCFLHEVNHKFKYKKYQYRHKNKEIKKNKKYKI